jgi:replicative DNA helicase
LAVLRRLIQAGGIVASGAYDALETGGAPETAIGHAEAALHHATRRPGMGGTWMAMEDLAGAHHTEVEAWTAEHGGPTDGIGLGIARLNAATGGVKAGEYLILAARPSVGKTTVATHMAQAAAVDLRKRVGIFSLEMSAAALTHRIVCGRAGLCYADVRKGWLPDDGWSKLSDAYGELSEAALSIDDTPGLTIAEMRSRARRLREASGLDLLIVDYLGLMQPTNERASRNEQVSEMSRGLKAMAKELAVPVIVLSQLNRGIEGRATERKGDGEGGDVARPRLSDLRDSGSLEQDADGVWFLSRDQTNGSQAAILSVAKNRNGPLLDIELRIELPTGRVFEVETSGREAPEPFSPGSGSGGGWTPGQMGG